MLIIAEINKTNIYIILIGIFNWYFNHSNLISTVTIYTFAEIYCAYDCSKPYDICGIVIILKNKHVFLDQVIPDDIACLFNIFLPRSASSSDY